MKKNPVYLVGGWTDDGRFVVSDASNSEKGATEKLKEAVKDRAIWTTIQYKVYKVYPEEFVENNDDIKFYDESQKIIDALDIQGNICLATSWKDNTTAIIRNISIYANRSFSFNDKTKTLIYRVTLQHYGDLKYHDKWEELEKEVYDSLYCVEIPKMKKVLRELDTNIRISIVDENRRKLIPGFITK